MELFYQNVFVIIGEYQLTSGMHITVVSNQHSDFDWAKISFNAELLNKIEIHVGDKAVIMLSSSDTYHEVFNGYVIEKKSKSNEVLLLDKMMLLQKTLVKSTFLNASPQEIIKYCLSAAKVESYRLSTEHYQSRNKFVVKEKNAVEVIRQIHQDWQIENKFYFRNDIFYWGCENEHLKEIYVFKHGENIISMELKNKSWELATVLVPFIKHSDHVYIDHPRVKGEFEVNKISHIMDSAGFIHTTIYFKENL